MSVLLPFALHDGATHQYELHASAAKLSFVVQQLDIYGCLNHLFEAATQERKLDHNGTSLRFPEPNLTTTLKRNKAKNRDRKPSATHEPIIKEQLLKSKKEQNNIYLSIDWWKFLNYSPLES